MKWPRYSGDQGRVKIGQGIGSAKTSSDRTHITHLRGGEAVKMSKRSRRGK